MDVGLIFLGVVLSIGTFICILSWCCGEFKSTKKAAYFTVSVGCFTTIIWTWVIIAFSVDLPTTEYKYDIEWIEHENGIRYQWAEISLDHGVNVTDKFGKVFPENAQLVVEHLDTKWAKGMHMSNEPDFRWSMYLPESEEQ